MTTPWMLSLIGGVGAAGRRLAAGRLLLVAGLAKLRLLELEQHMLRPLLPLTPEPEPGLGPLLPLKPEPEPWLPLKPKQEPGLPLKLELVLRRKLLPEPVLQPKLPLWLGPKPELEPGLPLKLLPKPVRVPRL